MNRSAPTMALSLFLASGAAAGSELTVPGIAENYQHPTRHLVDLLEHMTERDLDPFFERYYRGTEMPGMPE